MCFCCCFVCFLLRMISQQKEVSTGHVRETPHITKPARGVLNLSMYFLFVLFLLCSTVSLRFCCLFILSFHLLSNSLSSQSSSAFVVLLSTAFS